VKLLLDNKFLLWAAGQTLANRPLLLAQRPVESGINAPSAPA
jgi:hypothetical protein